MKLNAQEMRLAYEALRVVNAALTNHKLDLIRAYNAGQKAAEDPHVPEPAYTDLDKAFDVQDALRDLLRKLENALEPTARKSKRRRPKDGKNERKT